MKRWALAVLLAGAMLPVPARDDKKETDGLSLVPGEAKAFVSVRVADVWESALGKAVRAAMPKEAKELEALAKAEFGVGPAGIVRVSGAAEGKPDGGFLVLAKTKGKIAEGFLAKVINAGMEEKVGETTIRANEFLAGAVRDGTLLVLGKPDTVRAVLGDKAEKRGAGLEAALALARKHVLVIHGAPADLAKGMPPLLGEMKFLAKPFLAAQSVALGADLGAGLKASLSAEFADENDAAKAEKIAVAARAAGIAFFAVMKDDLAKMGKAVGELADAAEKTLEGSKVKRDGKALSVSFEFALGDEATARLVAEALAKMRQAASRTVAQNNLKQIALALHNYHATYGHLPPQAVYDKDGKALLSWRVLILPYLEQDALYKQFKLDEPWDSDHNKKLLAKMPKTYAPVQAKAAAHGTFYQGFFGKGAAWEGKKGLDFAKFTDGLSNTLMVAEAGKDVPWSKPDDIPFDAAKAVPKLGAEFADGFNAAFGDGSVRFITKSIKADTLKLLIQRNDGMPIPGF